MKEALEQVQRIVGYTFQNVSLLQEALTHSSYTSAASYQRLEFLGDAVLNLAFTNFVFLTNPSVGPGALSLLRAANISTEKLARVAIRHDFYRYLRRNSSKLDSMVKEFADAVTKEKEDDYGELLYGGNTIKAPKVLADVVESVAAAIYLDSKLDLAELWKVFRGILEPIVTAETLNEQPVTHIYHLCQKQGMSIEFKSWKEDNKSISNVFVDGVLLGVGFSEQKHIAKLNAARDALLKMCHDEAVDMTVVECSSRASVISEDQEEFRHLNAELVKKVYADGREEVDLSKQRLHKLCSKKHWQKPIYRVEDMQGPAHETRFICSVEVVRDQETLFAVGETRSRVKEAENSTAYKLLCQLTHFNS
ncbi:hypothetical protein HPP92_004979 [Vanilla planifolia]|uniref:Uncharacterized protein n=1 Tax=Vanilla planifolia TaxID=51239 RepID=A0A835RKI3_VANPL|nr:hypothetical protein HPP92_004979 [Vanilla planifolia]